MITVIKRIISPILIFILSKYLRNERVYSYEKIKVAVFPGVFHPGLFFSTKILLNHLTEYNFFEKKVLELGAGSGIISIYCQKRGAFVTASDISEKVIKNLHLNSKVNNASIKIILSDLFDNIPDDGFDFIIINPPYFAKDPISENDYAWYCGRDLEYFKKLFLQLEKFQKKKIIILMILSEDCQIDKIQMIAKNNNYKFKLVKKIKNWWEVNYLFLIECQK
ncbi:MAG: methyltransferase [Melioribacter sp.]|nr:methyltransferase [Melioribacter sp.]